MAFKDKFVLPIVINTLEEYKDWKTLWIKHHDTSHWSDEYCARVEAALEEYKIKSNIVYSVHKLAFNTVSETINYIGINFKNVINFGSAEQYNNTLFNDDCTGVVLYIPICTYELICIPDIIAFCEVILTTLDTFGDNSSSEASLIHTIIAIISHAKYPNHQIPQGVSDFKI